MSENKNKEEQEKEEPTTESTRDSMEVKIAHVIWEKDEIIGRLAKENAGLRARIEEGQRLFGSFKPDFERLSLRGGIKALIARIRELEAENKILGGSETKNKGR